MPPLRSRAGGNSRRFRWIVLVLLISVAVALWTGRSLGHVLYEEDPIERADTIFVLGGSWLERAAEAGELYLEGRAPLIVLSGDLPDRAAQLLRERGLDVPRVTDVQAQVLQTMGVPRGAITVSEEQLTTGTEAVTLRTMAAERGWRTIIVVTHKLHTARAKLVFKRHLEGTGVRVIMRATRYDTADVDYWWRRRVDFRFTIFEAQKLIGYWLGVIG